VETEVGLFEEKHSNTNNGVEEERGTNGRRVKFHSRKREEEVAGSPREGGETCSGVKKTDDSPPYSARPRGTRSRRRVGYKEEEWCQNTEVLKKGEVPVGGKRKELQLTMETKLEDRSVGYRK